MANSKVGHVACNNGVCSDMLGEIAMSITNRNYFMNRNKDKRDKTEHSSRPSLYFSYSCPKCGEPRRDRTVSKNRLSQPTRSKKLKCQQCGQKIFS